MTGVKTIAKRYYYIIAGIVIVLALAHLVMSYYEAYWYGYQLKPTYLFLFRLCIGAVEFLFCFVFAIALIVSLVTRRDQMLSISIFFLFICLVAMTFTKPNSDKLMIYGIRDRILRDCSPNELRQMADRIDRLEPPKDSLPGIGKVFMWDDLDLVKPIAGKVFRGLIDDHSIPSITEADKAVSIWWGRQQWGIVIGVNGKTPNLPPDQHQVILPVDKDIYFVGKDNQGG